MNDQELIRALAKIGAVIVDAILEQTVAMGRFANEKDAFNQRLLIKQDRDILLRMSEGIEDE